MPSKNYSCQALTVKISRNKIICKYSHFEKYFSSKVGIRTRILLIADLPTMPPRTETYEDYLLCWNIGFILLSFIMEFKFLPVFQVVKTTETTVNNHPVSKF